MLQGRFSIVRKASFIPKALNTSDYYIGIVTCKGSNTKRAPYKGTYKGSNTKRTPYKGSAKKALVDSFLALAKDSIG